MPFPSCGECVSSPLWASSSPSPGSHGTCPTRPYQGSVGIVSTSLVGAHSGETRGQPEEEKEGPSTYEGNQPLSPRKGLIMKIQIWYPVAGCFG